MPDRRHQPRPSSAQWHPGLLASLRASAASAGGESDEAEATEATDVVLGPVAAAPERGYGWFRAAKVPAADLDRLDRAALVDPAGQRRYRVLDIGIEDEVVFLRVQPAAPEEGLVLSLPRLDPAARYRDLLLRLEGPAAVKVVQPFARGVLDRLSPSEAGLDAHDRAVIATRTAGLHAVWAPPSTGSIEVITEALDAAMEAGMRCLLVSADAVALDASINRLVQRSSPRAGQVIRVGVARSPRLARNADVALPALVRARQPELRNEIDEQQQRVLAIREGRPRIAVREARQRLADFDPDDYRARSERLRTAALLGELTEASRAKEAEAAAHRQRLNEIEVDLRSRAESLQTTRLSEAEAAATDIRQQPATEGARLVSWRRRRRAATVLRAAEQRAENERATFAAVRAGSVDPTSLIDSDDALITERKTVHQADDAVRSRLGELRMERDRLTALPQPEPDDADVCRAAEEAGLPDLAAALPGLSEAARAADQELAQAGDVLAALIEQQQAAAPTIEAGLLDRASVVATTLAELIRLRSLTRRRYALVVVDQAAAAALPEVVFAAAQATRTCVLVGDFLQQGPVVAPEHRDDHYWDHDVFEHFGLTSARAAQHHPGCVLLDAPSRFGSTITDYLNAIAYQGVLAHQVGQGHRGVREGAASVDRTDEAELIWVDVDGLPSRLVTISSGSDEQQSTERSWPAGARVAVAVAEQHHALGQTVGVITPYQDQAALTRAAVDAAGLADQIFVGTPAQVQTRAFDVVVFDTVEDGQGWIAQARRDAVGPSADWCRDGLRVVDVALTRAGACVYLIASGRALRGDRGTPMGELVQLCASGAVPRLSARRILSPTEPAEADDPTEADERSAPGDVGVENEGDRTVVDQ